MSGHYSSFSGGEQPMMGAGWGVHPASQDFSFGNKSGPDPWGIGAPQLGGTPPTGQGIQWLGTADKQGVLGAGLGVANGVMNAYLGMKQYGIAKQSLKQGREQFDRNFKVQGDLTNASLSDRQAARVGGSAPGTYMPVAEYMAKYGVRGG